MSLPTRLFTEYFELETGEPWAYAPVVIQLFEGTYSEGVSYPRQTKKFFADEVGLLTFELTVTEGGELQAFYRVTYPNGETFDFTLLNGGDTTLSEQRILGTSPTDPVYGTLAAYTNSHLGGYVFSGTPVDGNVPIFSGGAVAWGALSASAITPGIFPAGAYAFQGAVSGITTLAATTVTAALTGNASTATTLQTARAINGVDFNGSAPITVSAAAGTLTGTALAASVVTSSLTTIGTLVAGEVPASLLTGPLAYARLPVGSDTWDIGAGNKLTFIRQVELLATGTLAVGVNAYGLLVGLTYTTAASGTHALIAGVRISAPVLTDGGAAVTDAATLYIAGEPAVGTNRYALRVVSGAVSFGGMLNAVGGIILGANIARSIGTSSTNISGGTATNSGGNIIIYGGAHATSPGAIQLRNDGVTVALFQGAVATITGLLAVSAGASFRTSALATNATTGHVFIPSSAGPPTGVPSTIPSGQVACQYDSTNHKLYVYSGAWRSTAALA